MSYKDDYKSIQVNLKKSKHQYLIDWLEQQCEEDEISLNSVIIQLIKQEYRKCQRKTNEWG
jgi:hypothetical protein